jgi:hypothetical protein
MNETICKECNKPFEKKRYWQRFCSPACRTKSFVRTRNEEVALGRKFKAQLATSHHDLFAA